MDCDIGDIITDEKGTEWVVNILNGTKQLCRMSDYDEFHIKEYFIDTCSQETIIYTKPDKADKPDIQSKNKKIKTNLKHS